MYKIVKHKYVDQMDNMKFFLMHYCTGEKSTMFKLDEILCKKVYFSESLHLSILI